MKIINEPSSTDENKQNKILPNVTDIHKRLP